MLKVGAGSNPAVAQGKTFCGRAIQQVSGGYLIRFGENQQHTGFAATTEPLNPNKELLFKVVGHRNGQPLLHPVFAGYR